MNAPMSRRAPRRRRDQDVLPHRGMINSNGYHNQDDDQFGHDRISTPQFYQRQSTSDSSRQPSLRRRGNSMMASVGSNQANQYESYNEISSPDFHATERIHSNTKRSASSRLIRLLFTSVIFFYSYHIGMKIIRTAVNVLFGHKQLYQRQKQLEIGTTKDFHIALRGSTDNDNTVGGMTIHDLNARHRHSLEVKEKTLGQTKSLTKQEQRVIGEVASNVQKKASEGYEVYMGEDSTIDYFFAGNIRSTQNIIDKTGRAKTATVPAQKYATLPLSVDSNPFALSMWIYLSPLSEMLDKDSELEDSRAARVILSTLFQSEDSHSGCVSEIFGGSMTGIVLYAQPDYGDNSGENMYRIFLEYSSSDDNSCRTIGLNNDAVLVSEGQWSHISIFVTRVDNNEIEADEGNERISIYVGGDLAGRKYVSGRFRSGATDTLIGRAGDVTSSKQSSVQFRGLGGRVGMLSFWEIGGPESLVNPSERMQVKSMEDEDHVARAINRAAFDLRAIRELSLQGLIVKEPNLLYTFDEQNDEREEGDLHDLYDEPTNLDIKEAIRGKDGTIRVADMSGTPVRTYEYVPLGGFRYPEYKDGNYKPPEWTDEERKELNDLAQARSVMVKNAMKHAWSGYRRYCWGKDELLPLSNTCKDNYGGLGTTLIDSLSTLWLMGMEEEFYQARDWVKDSLTFYTVEGGVSLFETTIRILGGLLSAFDLSGDKVFKWAADDLGQRLMKAFKTKSIIPYGNVELENDGVAYNTAWHKNAAVLSEIGSLQVEFRYLAKVTGRMEYATEAMRALDELLKIDTNDGLYPTLIQNVQVKPSFANDEISLGAMGDSFYEYLLKIWLQGGRKEMKYRKLYDLSMRGVCDKLIHISRPSYLTYVAELKYGRIVHKMDHLSCFLGGNLALGAYTHPEGLESSEAQRQLKTGKQLAYTCYQMYARHKSGLSPEYVDFRNGKNDFQKGRDASYYLLRPEVSETMFILYELTKDPTYREWGWEIFQAIEEQTKTSSAYASIKDVDTMEKDDRMESFFMAETLKYLYLLQYDNHTIDLLNTVSDRV